MRKFCAVIYLAFGVWCNPIAAQTEREDSLARQALASNDYAAVVAAYAGVGQTSLSDVALYRLAIAEYKLGRLKRAAELFARAEILNPRGTFASSPERLKSWKVAFAEAALAAEVVDRPPIEEAKPLAAPIAAPPDVAPVPVITASAAIAPAIALATQETLTGDRSTDALVPLLSKNHEASGLTYYWNKYKNFLNGLFGGLIISFFLCKQYLGPWLDRRARGHVSFFDLYLEKQLVIARDAIALLLIGIKTEPEPGQDAELYAALACALPLIEREVGRHRRLASQDDETLHTIERLKKQPMRLSTTKGVDVAALFQSGRR